MGMGILRELVTLARDVRDFGPSVLMQVFARLDADGYACVNTRVGVFKIRPSETDMNVLRQVFVAREYDFDRVPQGRLIRVAYEKALRSGELPLIIDAGANVGFAARFFSAAYPEAHIISIEPDPDNAALCRENTKGFPNIEVIEAAIGSKAGHVTMTKHAGEAWGARTHHAESGIKVVMINDLIARSNARPIIVKIDIEGFELELFSENTEWIDKTCAVVVEPHDWLFPEDRTSQTLQRAMLGTGRDFLILGGNVIWMKELTASPTGAVQRAPDHASYGLVDAAGEGDR